MMKPVRRVAVIGAGVMGAAIAAHAANAGIPALLLDIVPPGVLRRDAERAWELFHDPARSGVVVVSLPEDMPVTETIELVTALRRELDLPLAQVVVNALLTPVFREPEREALLADAKLFELARSGQAASAAEATIAAAARRAAREQIQGKNVARLRAELGGDLTVLPYLLGDAGTPGGIRELARRF